MSASCRKFVIRVIFNLPVDNSFEVKPDNTDRECSVVEGEQEDVIWLYLIYVSPWWPNT